MQRSMRIVAVLAGFLGGSTGFVDGQGQIIFNNRFPGVPQVTAPVYGIEPGGGSTILRGNATTNGGSITYSGELLSGTGYTAALYGGPETLNPNDLVLLSAVPFRPAGSWAGFIIQPGISIVVPGVPGGSHGTFQMRAWDNKNGTITNWAQVIGDPGTARGLSGMFNLTLTVPPNIPSPLVGLESFCLYLPEGAAEIVGQPRDVTIAPGATANFSVTVVSAAALTYQWLFNRAAISGATTSGLTVSSAQYPNVGDYQVVVGTSSSVTLTSRVARLVLQPSIVRIEQTTIEPWGVQAVRMTYDSTPNRAVHVEANNSLTGNLWMEIGSASSPVIRGFFFDVFSTNQVRVYRLRLD